MSTRDASFISRVQFIIDRSKYVDEEGHNLSENLATLARIVDFRDEHFKKIRPRLRNIVDCKLLFDLSAAVQTILDGLGKKPFPISSAAYAVVALHEIEDIRSGVVSVMVELSRFEKSLPLTDEAAAILHMRTLSWTAAKKKLWLLAQTILKAFPEFVPADVCSVPVHIQRYFLPVDALPVRQASGTDLSTKSLPTEFQTKLYAINCVDTFLENSPDKDLCSMCLYNCLSNANFAIVDSCEHLYCLECIPNHFKAADDAFCVVKDCKRRMRWYIKKQTLFEFRIPFRAN